MVMGVLPPTQPRRRASLRVRETESQMTGHLDRRSTRAERAAASAIDAEPRGSAPDGWADFFDKSQPKPQYDARFLDLFEGAETLSPPPLHPMPQCHVINAFELIRSLTLPQAQYVEIIDPGGDMDDDFVLEGRIVGVNRQI